MAPEPETLEGEWESSFHTVHYVMKLRERALSNRLKDSSFRSVVWQVRVFVRVFVQVRVSGVCVLCGWIL